MYNFDELGSYGDPNDIGPNEPAPRAPDGPPDERTDSFDVWFFDADESETVPDTYVVARDPFPLDFRMWVFVGHGSVARFVMRASHKYGPDDVVPGGRDDCCEVLFAGQSLTEEHCTESVETLVSELTGADIVFPGDGDTPGEKSDETNGTKDERSDDDHGGPIHYG